MATGASGKPVKMLTSFGPAIAPPIDWNKDTLPEV